MSDATSELEENAEALFADSKWLEALALADRAVEENPDSEFAHLLRYSALRHLDRNGDAIASVRRSIELFPSSAYARYLLASALFAVEDDTGALSSVERAIELDSDVLQYQRLRVRLLMQVDPSRAEEAAQALTKFGPLSADVLNLLGCLAEERSYAEARSFYRRAIETDPSCKDARHNYSRVFWASLSERAWRRVITAAVVLPALAAVALEWHGFTSERDWELWCAPPVLVGGWASSMVVLVSGRRAAGTNPLWDIEID